MACHFVEDEAAQTEFQNKTNFSIETFALRGYSLCWVQLFQTLLCGQRHLCL